MSIANLTRERIAYIFFSWTTVGLAYNVQHI